MEYQVVRLLNQLEGYLPVGSEFVTEIGSSEIMSGGKVVDTIEGYTGYRCCFV